MVFKFSKCKVHSFLIDDTNLPDLRIGSAGFIGELIKIEGELTKLGVG
jgi:hypothetical protein